MGFIHQNRRNIISIMSFVRFTETAMGVSIDALAKPDSEYIQAVKE